MKKISIFTLLIFIFISSSNASNINDFQVEEISVGDSLLKHFSRDEIEKSKQEISYYSEKKFGVLTFYKNSLKEYDAVSVTVKPGDPNYKIYSISGRIRYDNKLSECKNKMKIILKDISKILNNAKYQKENHPHHADTSGKSLTHGYVFYLERGAIDLYCVDWSREYESKSKSVDFLSLVIHSQEMREFLVKMFNKK